MNSKILYPLSVIFSASLIAGALIYSEGAKNLNKREVQSASQIDQQEIILPIKWNDLGLRMVASGVIDPNRLETIYQNRGGLSMDDRNLLYGKDNGALKINAQNSGYILNLLWALGLGNNNAILTQGEMMSSEYGGPANFASTAGWTVAKGNALEHYSKHDFVVLTPEEQDLVSRVSQNIYRPCCGNSTHFPDCNHGMAMLGLLELMASRGVSENDMYKYALKVNALWFPDNYAGIDRHLRTQGFSLESANPKEILGPNYSSLRGYQNILRKITPPAGNSGGSCGV